MPLRNPKLPMATVIVGLFNEVMKMITSDDLDVFVNELLEMGENDDS